MSYDLHLVRVPRGSRVRDAVNQCLASQETELNPGELDSAQEKSRKSLVDAILHYDPRLHLAPFDFDKIAALYKVELSEARRRYRHIELNCDDFSGIQITFWDTWVDVTFPYWHAEEQAQQVVRLVWDYLNVLQMKADFQIWDTQLDRTLNLQEDQNAVLHQILIGGQSAHERMVADPESNRLT